MVYRWETGDIFRETTELHAARLNRERKTVPVLGGFIGGRSSRSSRETPVEGMEPRAKIKRKIKFNKFDFNQNFSRTGKLKRKNQK
jgi:hypothetical protein